MIMDLLISTAHAAAPAAEAPSPAASLLPLLLMFVVFYFLIIRPQQKRFKTHQQLVEGVKRGDKIITSGGIVGTVMKVDNTKDLLHVEIAEGVNVKVVRSMVSGLLDESAPAGKDKKNAANDDAKEAA